MKESPIGKNFNRLTVVEFAYKKNHRDYWLCECECGNKIIAPLNNLNGTTKSCGCLRREKSIARFKLAAKNNRIEPGAAAFNELYNRYKQVAKFRKLEFKITKSEFLYITQQHCYYCGVEPQQLCRTRAKNGDYIYNGIDRVDNKIGYLVNNIVPCCGICNKAKYCMSIEDFLNWIMRITKYQ